MRAFDFRQFEASSESRLVSGWALILRSLQKAMDGPRPSLAVLVSIWLLSIVAPTVLRMMLQPLLGDTLWYATYYPAVLIVTLISGGRAGLIVIAVSAVVANYLFVPPKYDPGFSSRDIVGVVVYGVAAGTIVFAGALLRQAVSELRGGQEREHFLNRELQHRVKNSLAVVNGLAFQAVKTSSTASEFYDKFGDRLKALSRAHDLMANSDWRQCDMPALASSALEPFNSTGVIHLVGPVCVLRVESCVPLMLCLHELATNALKYGALSVEKGRVTLTWLLVPREHLWDLEISWAETEGPPVLKPESPGLGSRLLRQQPGLEAVKVSYLSGGVVCEIRVQDVGRASPAPRARAHGSAFQSRATVLTQAAEPKL
jgi:two-component sensor histidine kinase